MNRRAFFAGMVGASLGAVSLIPRRSTSQPTPATGSQPLSRAGRRRSHFLNVSLRTHEDQDVRFYDDLLKDKTVLIHFMYTECQDECPLTTATLVRVQSLLGERVGQDVFIYSISVDPERDTPATLKGYAEFFRVKPGWLFLTGTPATIAQVREQFGDDPTLQGSQSNHLNMLRLGIEPLERWAGCPTWSTAETIVRYLSWMEPHGQRPKGRVIRH